MNGATVTQLPTLCNPDMLTHEELIEEYKYMEDAMFHQSQTLHEVSSKLHEMNTLAHNLSSIIYALCDSFDAGDQAAILLQVKKLAEQRSRHGKGKAH